MCKKESGSDKKTDRKRERLSISERPRNKKRNFTHIFSTATPDYLFVIPTGTLLAFQLYQKLYVEQCI